MTSKTILVTGGDGMTRKMFDGHQTAIPLLTAVSGSF